jgi:hypothetical protein
VSLVFKTSAIGRSATPPVDEDNRGAGVGTVRFPRSGPA